MERREVHYSGRVQGVGFRFTTDRIATEFDVVGFVQNLPDGRVHLIAEGTTRTLDNFLESISDTMAGKIHSQHVEADRATGEFEEFGVRY